MAIITCISPPTVFCPFILRYHLNKLNVNFQKHKIIGPTELTYGCSKMLTLAIIIAPFNLASKFMDFGQPHQVTNL